MHIQRIMYCGRFCSYYHSSMVAVLDMQFGDNDGTFHERLHEMMGRREVILLCNMDVPHLHEVFAIPVDWNTTQFENTIPVQNRNSGYKIKDVVMSFREFPTMLAPIILNELRIDPLLTSEITAPYGHPVFPPGLRVVREWSLESIKPADWYSVDEEPDDWNHIGIGEDSDEDTYGSESGMAEGAVYVADIDPHLMRG